MKLQIVISSIILGFLLMACAPRLLHKSYDQQKVKKLYGNSISDAAFPQASEISNQLTAINSENNNLKWKTINEKEYLLVSTWTKDTTFYKTRPEGRNDFNTGIGEIWVTIVPELQKLCREEKFGRKEGLDLRLKQLIGLPPTTTKTHFVEIWVQPKDLFRPCPDADIQDSQCDLCFTDDAEESYVAWFNKLRVNSYYNCNWDWNYPWTQMGYTYDWNPKNKTHQGLSEFIIRQNSDIWVNAVYSTEAYCQPVK